MTPTVEYIRLKFEEFNRLCFEGRLEPIPIRLSSSRRFLGQVTFYRKKNPDGTWHFYGFTFRINTKMDMPENVVEDTIIHEMIHYWILSNQMQDTSAHGELFKQKMREINVKHNRNVSITHRFTKEDRDKDTERRQHLICITRLCYGKLGVTIAARSRLFRLWDEMAKIPDATEQKWVTTTDPYFNRIPRALTPKIYLIPADELEEHLQGAQELVRRGNNIMIKK